VLGVKINSQQSGVDTVRVDWRASSAFDHAISLEPFEIPSSVRERLIALMRLLRINAGSADLIVDKDGEYHFLEINEVGQMLFLEDRCPDVPVLDAFCRFLKSKDAHFLYKQPSNANRVRLSDFFTSGEVMSRNSNFERQHTPLVNFSIGREAV